MTRRTLAAAAAVLLGIVALSGCDTGSRALTPQFYTFQIDSVQQSRGGAITVTGTTDLPDNTEVDAILATAGPATHAAQRAVLSGTTATLGGQAVSRHHFRVVVEQALTLTCHDTPPCGPFAAGRYLLLLDAAVPTDLAQSGQELLSDPRYLAVGNGLRGEPALETTRTLDLHPIGIRVDDDGHQVDPDFMTEATATP
jgi:hypothetical protein